MVYAGDERTFTIPGSYGDIEVVDVDSDVPEVAGYYNLRGVRSENPWKGLNVILYSDGTTEKRVMK